MRPGTPDDWIPPWRESLPQAVCAGCGTRCVALTLTREHCAQCCQRLKIVAAPLNDNDPGEQLSLTGV